MFKSLANFFKNLPPKTQTISADELLKMATEKKDIGEVDTAIELLRKAYAVIAISSVSYSVSIFLRLPLYLQKAGRNDEAWREFNLLLTHGFPNQLKNLEVLPMEHSEIYDKMRLFLQREKKFDVAIRFGVLSYITRAIGLHRQKRKDELKYYVEKQNIEENLIGIIKKAKKVELKSEIMNVVLTETENLPNIDLGELGRKIDKIVFR
jgi:hypothetical protein